MPDPLLYLKAMGASASISALFVLAIIPFGRAPGMARLNAACVLGISIGLAVGFYVLGLRFAWPPVNGLDRLFLIVVPTALSIELIAGFQSVPRWVAWLMRASLAATIPRILLHSSVYLAGSVNDLAQRQSAVELAACGGLLAGSWGLLSWLAQRSPGVSIPLALTLTTQCSGLTIMMTGYIKGGATAFLLSATLVGTTLASSITSKRFSASTIIGVGVVGLFGMLFIGRFFGRLSTGCALTMLLAPLLCWVSETPLLRHRKPWLAGSIRLLLVAIPLLTVLAVAKRDFDRDIAPLLGKVMESTDQFHRAP